MVVYSVKDGKIIAYTDSCSAGGKLTFKGMVDRFNSESASPSIIIDEKKEPTEDLKLIIRESVHGHGEFNHLEEYAAAIKCESWRDQYLLKRKRYEYECDSIRIYRNGGKSIGTFYLDKVYEDDECVILSWWIDRFDEVTEAEITELANRLYREGLYEIAIYKAK